MAYTSLSNVAMDTAVPFNTGQEQPREVEECRCPEGHRGTSCEECAPGYYRDRSAGPYGMCRRCPCSNNEESCVQQSDSRVVCQCRQGFSGRNCEIQGECPALNDKLPNSMKCQRSSNGIGGVKWDLCSLVGSLFLFLFHQTMDLI